MSEPGTAGPPVPSKRALGPIEMVVLQGTSFCNLNCSYCYLSRESRLSRGAMGLKTLRTIVARIFDSPFVSDRVRFSWHSGEPMVLGPTYYRDAIAAILGERDKSRHPDLSVDFDIQTNGTLLNDAWCTLIREMDGRLLIGVSCDGPADLHDSFRKNWNGKDSHAATHKGMTLLKQHGIPFDVTAVVSPETLEAPERFLSYFATFRDHIREFHYNLHDEFFIEDENNPAIERYAERYCQFLERVLALFSGPGAGDLPKICNFSNFYNRLFVDAATRPDYEAAEMSRPFKTLSIEINGDVTTFYAGLTKDECSDLADIYGDGKGLVIGNLLEESLEAVSRSDKLERIARDFDTSHKACADSCDFHEVCSGGYNLIKYRRFGRFDRTETPECRVHVKTFAETLLNDITRAASSRSPTVADA